MINHLLYLLSIIQLVLFFLRLTRANYTFACPTKEQWSLRSSSRCIDTSYYCLYDINTGGYREQCLPFPAKDTKGFRKVFAGNIDGIECTTDTYQPFWFWTNGSSDCVYMKSLCSEEGQVVQDDGSNMVDRRCRCDYKHGYNYVTKPRDICNCVPSEEDCSCYRMSCPQGHLLSPDYECRNTNNWKATFGCSPLNTVPHVTEAPLVFVTVAPTNYKTESRSLIVITVLGCIAIIYIIGIFFVIYWLHNRDEVDSKTEDVYINIKQEVIPQNIKDFQEETIYKWRGQLKVFFPTRASSAVAACLESNQCVIITGPPGCGKTFTAYSVVMEMVDCKGYDLLIIEDPNDIIRYSRTDIKQLLFIDDIIGKYSVNDYNTGWWKYHDKQAMDLLSKNPNLRILATCRSYIYHLYIKTINVVFHCVSLTSGDICLSSEEKEQIGREYIGNRISSISNEAIKAYDFFPELCRLLTEADNIDMLHSSCRYMENELNHLLKKSVEAFLLLSIMVLSNNSLTLEDLIAFNDKGNDMNKSISQEIMIDLLPAVRNENLDALVETYFVKSNGIYEFKTKHLFNIVSFCITKFIMKTLLKFGQLQLLIEKLCCDDQGEMKWILTLPLNDHEKQDAVSCSATLPFDVENMYFERMISAIKARHLIEVFTDQKNFSIKYRHRFVTYMSQCKRLTCRDIREYEKQKTTKRQSTVLHVTASLGYVEYVKYFVQLDEQEIKGTDDDGRTPLHLAALNGHASVVEFLIDYGSRIDIEDNDGNTPLDFVCLKEHIEIAEILLANKAAIKQNKRSLSTPLFTVCKNGNMQLAEMLLKSKAKVNVRDEDMFTPLQLAVINGHQAVTNLLLDNQAEVNVIDTKEQTPLYHACKANNVEMAVLLIDKEADVSIQNCNKEIPLHVACANGCFTMTALLTSIKCKDTINHQDINGNTPLYNACMRGNFETVELLLQKGADGNISNNSLSRPIHAASARGFHTIVECLLEYNSKIDVQNVNKETSLHLSCKAGHDKVVSLLLSKSAYPCLEDTYGQTPLFVAYLNDQPEIVELLIAHPDVYNFKNEKGESLFFACVKKKFANLANLLIEKGFDFDYQNADGLTPLHVACDYGSKEVSSLLVGKGIDINQLTSKGNTPLHLAVRKGFKDLTVFLIKNGALIKKTNGKGERPIESAIKEHRYGLVQLLLQHGADKFDKDGKLYKDYFKFKRNKTLLKILTD